MGTDMGADTMSKDESIRLMQAEIERLQKERDSAFATWKARHVTTLNAFIKNEHEPLKAEIERLRGLLWECVENDAATSTVQYDPSVPGCTRIAWSADDWNKRVREALGERPE